MFHLLTCPHTDVTAGAHLLLIFQTASCSFLTWAQSRKVQGCSDFAETAYSAASSEVNRSHLLFELSGSSSEIPVSMNKLFENLFTERRSKLGVQVFAVLQY